MGDSHPIRFIISQSDNRTKFFLTFLSESRSPNVYLPISEPEGHIPCMATGIALTFCNHVTRIIRNKIIEFRILGIAFWTEYISHIPRLIPETGTIILLVSQIFEPGVKINTERI